MIKAQKYRRLLIVNWKNEFGDKIIYDDSIPFWSSLRKYKNALDENCSEELAIVALWALYYLPLSNTVMEHFIFTYYKCEE